MHHWQFLNLASWTLLVSKRAASVKYTTVLEYNSGFSPFILNVLQCLHKSRRKRNPNEITDYFVFTAIAHVAIMYFVPVCTSAYHMEKHKTYNDLNHS